MEHQLNLYLVRHGETYLNQYKKMQGWADSPLTNKGKDSAIETGKKLKEVQFSSVYTSDLGRTIETAELILEQNNYSKNLKIKKIKELREAFFGHFEGDFMESALRKIAQENGSIYHEVDDIFQHHTLEEVLNFISKSDPLQHAENYNDVWKRIEKSLNVIVSNHYSDNDNILLVTHGVIIGNMIDRFSKDVKFEGEIKNSSINLIKYSSNTFNVISYNQ